MREFLLQKNEQNKGLKIATYISFFTLSLFPVLKENYNSITIIICAVLFLINFIIDKRGFLFTKELFFFTLIFWMFFFHEIITNDFVLKTILLHLPFLVFPVLFLLKPEYIDKKSKSVSIIVFQISVLIASVYFLIVFFQENEITQLFDISRENIPFFRDFVSRNKILNIHPTYFSTFLLISFTISSYKIVIRKMNQREIIINIVNIVFVAFMIFLFSSRIVIATFLLTVFVLTIVLFKNLDKKRILTYLVLIVFGGVVSLMPFKELLSKRFKEVITEYEKPVKGNYHNSTNIRVAVLKCSLELLHDMPYIGYGEKLQEELDICYETFFDSNFNQISEYNTHNYFLNLILYGGWVFIILFIFYILYLILKLKHSVFALIFVFQILIINITENYFSRHYGIVTFNYFICMLYFIKKGKSNNIKAILK